MARDWRDDRIEELEALLRAQQQTSAEQQQTIAGLKQQIRELQAQLARYSGNSSRPPSSDPPGAPPPARPKRTGRKRGGQPGHQKQTRALVPPEQVTRTHVLKPCACRRCGNVLSGEDPEPIPFKVTS